MIGYKKSLHFFYHGEPTHIKTTFDRDHPECVAGAHFTNDFSITIQMWWKFHFALIQVLIKWSLQNLARQLGCRGMCQILLRYDQL